MNKKHIQKLSVLLLFVSNNIFAINVTATLNQVINTKLITSQDQYKKLRDNLAIIKNKVKGQACKEFVQAEQRNLEHKFRQFLVDQELKKKAVDSFLAKKGLEKAEEEEEEEEEEGVSVQEVLEEMVDETKVKIEHAREEKKVEKKLEILETLRRIAERTGGDLKFKRSYEGIMATIDPSAMPIMDPSIEDYFNENLVKLLMFDDGYELYNGVANGGRFGHDIHSAKNIKIVIDTFLAVAEKHDVINYVQASYENPKTKKQVEFKVQNIFKELLRVYDALLLCMYSIAPGGDNPPPRNTLKALKFIQDVVGDVSLLPGRFYATYDQFMSESFVNEYENGSLNISYEFEQKERIEKRERTATLIKASWLPWPFSNQKVTIEVPALTVLHKKDYLLLVASWFNELSEKLGYDLEITTGAYGEKIEGFVSTEGYEEGSKTTMQPAPEFSEDNLQRLLSDIYAEVDSQLIYLQIYVDDLLENPDYVDTHGLDSIDGFIGEVIGLLQIYDIDPKLHRILIDVLLPTLQNLFMHQSEHPSSQPLSEIEFAKFVQKHVGISNYDNTGEKWQELNERIDQFFAPVAGDTYSVEQVHAITRYGLILLNNAIAAVLNEIPKEVLEQVLSEEEVPLEVEIREETIKISEGFEEHGESTTRHEELVEVPEEKIIKSSRAIAHSATAEESVFASTAPEGFEERSEATTRHEQELERERLEKKLPELTEEQEKLMIAVGVVEPQRNTFVSKLQQAHQTITDESFERTLEIINELATLFLSDDNQQVQEFYDSMVFLQDHELFKNFTLDNLFVYVCTLFDAVRHKLYQKFADIPSLKTSDDVIESLSLLLRQERIDEVNEHARTLQEQLITLINNVYERWKPWLSHGFKVEYDGRTLDLTNAYEATGLPGIISQKDVEGGGVIPAYYQYSISERFVGYQFIYDDQDDYFARIKTTFDELKKNRLKKKHTDMRLLVLPAIKSTFSKDYNDLFALIPEGKSQAINSKKAKKEAQQEMQEIIKQMGFVSPSGLGFDISGFGSAKSDVGLFAEYERSFESKRLEKKRELEEQRKLEEKERLEQERIKHEQEIARQKELEEQELERERLEKEEVRKQEEQARLEEERLQKIKLAKERRERKKEERRKHY